LPIITLTTDFGTADGYVGAMKGVILRLAPSAVVVDIAHDVAPHDVAAGAFALAQAAREFPPGTIHVAVVDPGVGGDRAAVVVDDGRYRFVGPDNGLLALAVARPHAAWLIEAPELRAPAVAPTFHGRDVFAVAAARLAAGASPASAGRAIELAALDGAAGAREGAARVVHVDRFGNLITDRRADELPAGARFRAGGRDISALSSTYTDVPRGALLAYVGSAGTLEIAVREGRAADLLGVGRGDPVDIVDAAAAGGDRAG
jgi:S-adenosylmethionine hydrolase